MHAIEHGPDGLVWREQPTPEVAAGEVLIEVAAAGVNRADLLQVAGHYPPPPGASEILGLEAAGVVAAVGSEVTDWAVGDAVCALLAGGGYAEQVAVPAEQVLPIPPGLTMIQAAALPEVTCTVWSNLVMTARLTEGERLLVHGGASGIGTMAIQLGRAIGARVAVTGSRDDALARCAELGAELTINYRAEDFVERIRQWGGADVILDVVGAKYLQRNISALRPDGRLVIIGMQGGRSGELDIAALLATRGSVIASSLRGRPVRGPGSKGEVVQQVRQHVWPLIAAGTVRPIVDQVFALPDAGAAQAALAAGGHFGKMVLAADGAATDNDEGLN